ncbi:DNA processing protein, partial [Streptomyces sp. OspMP-M43]
MTGRTGEAAPGRDGGREADPDLGNGQAADRNADREPDPDLGGGRDPDRSRGSDRGPDRGREAERLARAALTRVLEPGDERAGRWLRRTGPVELMRRLTVDDGSAERLPGMTAARLGGYRLRAAGAEPGRDLAAV